MRHRHEQRCAIACSNNLFYNNGTMTSQRSANPGDIFADPKFVNQAAGNYHLQAGSPAIDAGCFVGLPFKGAGRTSARSSTGTTCACDSWAPSQAR